MKFIVFAGGQGTKLWPMSRESKPKQFQPIVGDVTLFRQNIDALLKKYSARDIFVATKRMYVKYVVEDAPEIPLENIIVEPDVAKNTGPAVGLAIIKVAKRYPKEPFMIIQADCLRKPDTKFVEMIELAEKFVKKEKKLITGGQKALYPDMGIDYLKLGEVYGKQKNIDIFKIEKFIPRLDTLEETKKLISNFRIATHSNHYCWYPDLMLAAYKKYKPQWHKSLMKINSVLGKKNEAREVEKIYSTMEAGTTEDVTRHIFNQSYIIMTPFKWVDMGTWGVIGDFLSQPGKNYADGNVLTIDTKNSFIKGNKNKLIATIGLDSLLVVDTDDALLICSKNRAQDVKKVVDELKKKGKKYL